MGPGGEEPRAEGQHMESRAEVGEKQIPFKEHLKIVKIYMVRFNITILDGLIIIGAFIITR